MDNQPLGTAMFWVFFLGAAAIALAPLAVQALRTRQERRRRADEAAQRDRDEHWNSVIRDAK